MSDCAHTNFESTVRIDRLTDGPDPGGVVRHFIAEITARCTDCGVPFHFVGLPAGVSFTHPTVNVGATELHAPIAPGVAPLPEHITYEIPEGFS